MPFSESDYEHDTPVIGELKILGVSKLFVRIPYCVSTTSGAEIS